MIAYFGAALIFSGVIIQMLNWRNSTKFDSLINSVDSHMTRVDIINSKHKFTKIPKKGEMINKDGIDIGETMALLEEGMEMASIKNKEILQDLKDSKEAIVKSFPMYISWVLIAVGTIFSVL